MYLGKQCASELSIRISTQVIQALWILKPMDNLRDKNYLESLSKLKNPPWFQR